MTKRAPPLPAPTSNEYPGQIGQRGLSLVELVFFIVVISAALAGVLRVFMQAASSSAGCATLPESLGPESGETRYSAPQFDNVNDYNGFAMSGGLQDITHTALPGLAGYSASIGVAAAALGNISAASGDALLITVSVTGPGATQIVLNGYRSRYAPNAAL